MSKKVFRSIWLVALVIFALSLALIMGALYSYFSGVQQKQLRIGTQLTAQGVALNGMEYFSGLDAGEYRVTWIAADGTVLYDNESDSAEMENHLEREEVQQALESGYGESSRYSNTISQKHLYCAQRLPDGTVIRLSVAQNTVWILMLGFAQPICVVILIALVLSLVLASRISKTIVEPINSINLDEPMQYVEREEYAEIEPLLRRMATQQAQLRRDQQALEKNSQIRQEFTSNVSHELKTPLHVISGYAELMENGLVKEEDIRPFARKIRTESLRLTALVEDIIDLTRLDGGADEMQLCAQALCLEEMFVTEIPEGAIYYGETRHRLRVELTPELRAQVRDALSEMHRLFERGHTPRAKMTRACKGCSMAELCQPALTKQVSASEYVRRAMEDEA